MNEERFMSCVIERCDFYLDNALISKEYIIKEYAKFLANKSMYGRSIQFSFHTGSICFDAIMVAIASLRTLFLDQTDPADTLRDLAIGQMVMYQNKRYRFKGTSFNGDIECVELESEAKGRHGPVIREIPSDACRGNLIPYSGNATFADGRGIRKARIDRNTFLTKVCKGHNLEIPAETNVSAVFVSDRNYFERIANGLRIYHGAKDYIELLELVNASYYTSNGKEHQIGRNPAKRDPEVKVTGKLSTARDLVLESGGNDVIGLAVIGNATIAKGLDDLDDLLTRRKLQFIHVAAGIDCEQGERLIDGNPDSEIFACTSEFLSSVSGPCQDRNQYTNELHKKMSVILNKEVADYEIEGGISAEESKRFLRSIRTIRQSYWDEEQMVDFIRNSYSLFNLLSTAAFPLEDMEIAIESGHPQVAVMSPRKRIDKLWELANSAGSIDMVCAEVVDTIEQVYKRFYDRSPKQEALRELLERLDDPNIAIIVPKPYYIDILSTNPWIRDNIVVTTPKKLDKDMHYDVVIMCGNAKKIGFDPFASTLSEYFVTLLYEAEKEFHDIDKKAEKRRAEKMNARIRTEHFHPTKIQHEISDKDPLLTEMLELDLELSQYVDRYSSFDLDRFVAGASQLGGQGQLTEVRRVGHFDSGEFVLFSNYYQALVYDGVGKKIVSKTVKDLLSEDILVFTNRDDLRRNMVDHIYQIMQEENLLDDKVVEATEMAGYWKEALREYQQMRGFNFSELTKELGKFGSSLTEITIRSWLTHDSHIVGPNELITIEQIALLTRDPYLLKDPNAYYQACRIVRRQRRSIIKMINQIVADMLTESATKRDERLKAVYDNVEHLARMLTLDRLEVIDDPLYMPSNYLNRPIDSEEIEF